MRQFCLGSQARRLACLAFVGFVGCLVLSGLPTSATNSSRAVWRQVSDSRQDQQPEFVSNNYRQTSLVSDLPGFAQLQDPLLINPWGLAQLPTSPFWVANSGSSTATLYGGRLRQERRLKSRHEVELSAESVEFDSHTFSWIAAEGTPKNDNQHDYSNHRDNVASISA